MGMNFNCKTVKTFFLSYMGTDETNGNEIINSND